MQQYAQHANCARMAERGGVTMLNSHIVILERRGGDVAGLPSPALEPVNAPVCTALFRFITVMKLFMRNGLSMKWLERKASTNGPPTPAYARVFPEKLFFCTGRASETEERTSHGCVPIFSRKGECATKFNRVCAAWRRTKWRLASLGSCQSDGLRLFKAAHYASWNRLKWRFAPPCVAFCRFAPEIFYEDMQKPGCALTTRFTAFLEREILSSWHNRK